MKQRIINPSTGEVIAELELAEKKEVESAISSARVAFDKGRWPGISWEERKNFLLRISQGILYNAI